MSIREANAAKVEADRRRREIISEYESGKLSITDVIELSKMPANRPLKKIRIHSLISKHSGWSEGAVKATLAANKFSQNANIGDALNNPRLREAVATMGASTFLKVTSPPRIAGWPWKGSVLAAIKELNDNNIGKELLDVNNVVFDETSIEEEHVEEDEGVPMDDLFGSDYDSDENEEDNEEDGFDLDDLLSDM